MLKDMLQWAEIRRRVLVDGVSKRQILRETGMHWTTLEKILRHSEPPGYRTDTPRAKPKLGPYLDRIAQILEDDKHAPRKQRHTAKRIFSGSATRATRAVTPSSRRPSATCGSRAARSSSRSCTGPARPRSTSARR